MAAEYESSAPPRASLPPVLRPPLRIAPRPSPHPRLCPRRIHRAVSSTLVSVLDTPPQSLPNLPPKHPVLVLVHRASETSSPPPRTSLQLLPARPHLRSSLPPTLHHLPPPLRHLRPPLRHLRSRRRLPSLRLPEAGATAPGRLTRAGAASSLLYLSLLAPISVTASPRQPVEGARELGEPARGARELETLGSS
jgi:hypothetical protein